MSNTRETGIIMFLVAGMLITGSVNTVSKKLGYDLCSYSPIPGDYPSASDCEGEGYHKFKKPWTFTLVMFAGEAMCLWIFWLNRMQDKKNNPGNKETPYQRISLKESMIMILPGCCDLLGTTISGIGLLLTAPSVFQMLRGSIILFVAIFSVVFLGRRLLPYSWFGMFITICGVTCVGISSVFAPKATGGGKGDQGNLVWLGNLLVVVSQMCSATQMVIEEKFLKDKNFPSEFVVGMEGFWGALVMICIGLPIVSMLPGRDGQGVHESSIDAFYLLINDFKLFMACFAYFSSIAFYNFFGLSVSKKLSSVHRCLIDACRTVLVWAAQLALFYGSDGHFGEAWKGKWSLIQLGGFVVLILGSSIYYKVVRLPGFVYEEDLEDDELEQSEPLVGTESSASFTSARARKHSTPFLECADTYSRLTK